MFLPPDFDTSRPVAIIAGKGMYPEITYKKIKEAGVSVRLIAFEGETRDALFDSFAAEERVKIKVGQLGHMLKSLNKLGAGYAIMAGQITPKRLFKGLHPDLKAVTILTKLKEKNAESIFGAIAKEIEQIGVTQLDARAFLDDQLADVGSMTLKRANFDNAALSHGIKIAKECARLDIGQGVVVNRGTILAVEAFEGTDKMLERVGQFEAKEPLFIKTVKPSQDYRFDVPVFGMRTLETMLKANIRMAALEAANTIILDKQNVLEAARKEKVLIWGYEA